MLQSHGDHNYSSRENKIAHSNSPEKYSVPHSLENQNTLPCLRTMMYNLYFFSPSVAYLGISPRRIFDLCQEPHKRYLPRVRPKIESTMTEDSRGQVRKNCDKLYHNS